MYQSLEAFCQIVLFYISLKKGINAGSVSFDTDVSDAHYKEHLIGSISIPSINVDIPLFDTTNDY